nr:hypothetical protein [Tanacetum cinerariifolium]
LSNCSKKQEKKRIEEEQAAKAQNRKIPVCYDDDDYEEESNSLKDNIISELSPCFAITPNELVDSLSMGDEHLDTISETESGEFIKSSVENLVPNPSESKGENGCDVLACFTTFSNILFDDEYEFDSSDDQSLHNEDFSKKIFSNPLFDEEIIFMRTDQHHFNAVSNLVESLRAHDSSIISSSSKINFLFDEFADELTLLKSIPPGIDATDCHLENEIRLIERLLYDNSSPRPPEEFVSENSDADIESFSPSPIPNEDKLPSNYSISLPVNESFHFDIPTFSRPPAKPPDGDRGILNIKMMGDVSDQKAPMPRLMITLAANQEKSPDLLYNRGLKIFLSDKCPMMIHGKNILDGKKNCFSPTIYYDDDDEDYAIAVTPSSLTKEPDNSLSMGDKHLDTVPAMESDEFIKSSVETLVPIPSESEGIPDNMCDVPFHDNSPPLDVSKDQFEDFSDSNDESTSADDDSFSIDNIEYVEASPPDSELVSSETISFVKKMLNVNLLIANIEALNDNPTSSFDLMTKSSSTSLNSLLEETNIFDNSLPEFEILCFDLEEISSGGTTTRSDISLPEYEAFYDDHVKEISSGSTTTHSDSSLHDSFIFDLSLNPFPLADKSDFYEFADELTHIISPPEYDCFCFKIEPNSGDFTMDVVEDTFPTREPRVHNALPTHLTLQLNLDFILSSESLFAYVVWIFLSFLSYSVDP